MTHRWMPYRVPCASAPHDSEVDAHEVGGPVAKPFHPPVSTPKGRARVYPIVHSSEQQKGRAATAAERQAVVQLLDDLCAIVAQLGVLPLAQLADDPCWQTGLLLATPDHDVLTRALAYDLLLHTLCAEPEVVAQVLVALRERLHVLVVPPTSPPPAQSLLGLHYLS